MKKHKVLFVCSGPGVRGRIAEAYLKQFSQFDAHSAQFEEREGELPQFIQSLMTEVEIELNTTFPKSVFARHKANEKFDYVITLCHAAAQVVCPIFQSNVNVLYAKKAQRLSWTVLDFRSLSLLPAEERLPGARNIRDQIKQEVADFVARVSTKDHLIV